MHWEIREIDYALYEQIWPYFITSVDNELRLSVGGNVYMSKNIDIEEFLDSTNVIASDENKLAGRMILCINFSMVISDKFMWEVVKKRQ